MSDSSQTTVKTVCAVVEKYISEIDFSSFDTSDVIAFFAFIVSGVAASFTYKQAKQSREHNVLSTRPVLNFVHKSHEGATKALILSNKGLGPARILSFEIKYKDKVQNLDTQGFMSILTSIGKAPPKFSGKEFTLQPEYYVSVDDTIPIFEVLEDNMDKLAKESKHALKQLKAKVRIEIKYECLYGNEYTLTWPNQSQL